MTNAITTHARKRREAKMTAKAEPATLETMLRPYATHPCRQQVWNYPYPHPQECACGGTGFDKRFDALRLQSKLVENSTIFAKTDLGAILEAAIACGKEVVTAVLVELTIDMENRLVLPELRTQPLAGPVANAFVAAVPLA